jgi:hypothetical protein
VVYEIEIITRDRRRAVLEVSMHLVMRNGQPVEIQGIALPPGGSLMQTRALDADFALGTLSGTG